MSLEIEIGKLNNTITQLIELLSNKSLAVQTKQPEVVESVVQPAQGMPSLPSFEDKEEQKSKYGITNTNELQGYVLKAYKEMGHEKGSQISNILKNMGFNSVKDVTPDKFDQLIDNINGLLKE